MLGYIPPKLWLISKAPETIVNQWEDGSEINSFEASPTFVASNEKTKETGLSWACGYGNKRGVTTIEVENIPFAQLRIVSYEKRNEGGGAFKAIVQGKYYVDLRTDTLLDILVNHAVESGEVKGASFIWARVGSNMKVVRVGSSLHRDLIAATELDAVKPPKASDLKVGDVYESKNGGRAVFMGWVSTIKMEVKQEHWNATQEISFVRVPKIQCWYRVYQDESINKSLREWRYWGFEFKKTNAYRKKVDSIKIPADWMKKAKESAVSDLNSLEKQCRADRPGDMAYYSQILHLFEVGVKVGLHERFDRWKQFFKE